MDINTKKDEFVKLKSKYYDLNDEWNNVILLYAELLKLLNTCRPDSKENKPINSVSNLKYKRPSLKTSKLFSFDNILTKIKNEIRKKQKELRKKNKVTSKVDNITIEQLRKYYLASRGEPKLENNIILRKEIYAKTAIGQIKNMPNLIEFNPNPANEKYTQIKTLGRSRSLDDLIINLSKPTKNPDIEKCVFQIIYDCSCKNAKSSCMNIVHKKNLQEVCVQTASVSLDREPGQYYPAQTTYSADPYGQQEVIYQPNQYDDYPQEYLRDNFPVQEVYSTPTDYAPEEPYEEARPYAQEGKRVSYARDDTYHSPDEKLSNIQLKKGAECSCCGLCDCFCDEKKKSKTCPAHIKSSTNEPMESESEAYEEARSYAQEGKRYSRDERYARDEPTFDYVDNTNEPKSEVDVGKADSKGDAECTCCKHCTCYKTNFSDNGTQVSCPLLAKSKEIVEISEYSRPSSLKTYNDDTDLEFAGQDNISEQTRSKTKDGLGRVRTISEQTRSKTYARGVDGRLMRYDDDGQLMRYDDDGQVIRYDDGKPIRYDDNGKPIRYDDNGKLIRYDDDGKPIRYDGNGKPIRYDDNGKPIRYDDNGKPIRYDDDGKPIRYDGNGKPIRYDDNGKSIRYDDDGKPIRYDDDGKPIRYDDDGKPIRYDDDGKPIRYDDNGKPIRYDDDGKPIRYDDNGKPIRYDDDGKPIRYDEDGQPIADDEYRTPTPSRGRTGTTTFYDQNAPDGNKPTKTSSRRLSKSRRESEEEEKRKNKYKNSKFFQPGAEGNCDIFPLTKKTPDKEDKKDSFKSKDSSKRTSKTGSKGSKGGIKGYKSDKGGTKESALTPYYPPPLRDLPKPQGAPIPKRDVCCIPRPCVPCIPCRPSPCIQSSCYPSTCPVYNRCLPVCSPCPTRPILCSYNVNTKQEAPEVFKEDKKKKNIDLLHKGLPVEPSITCKTLITPKGQVTVCKWDELNKKNKTNTNLTSIKKTYKSKSDTDLFSNDMEEGKKLQCITYEIKDPITNIRKKSQICFTDEKDLIRVLSGGVQNDGKSVLSSLNSTKMPRIQFHEDALSYQSFKKNERQFRNENKPNLWNSHHKLSVGTTTTTTQTQTLNQTLDKPIKPNKTAMKTYKSVQHHIIKLKKKREDDKEKEREKERQEKKIFKRKEINNRWRLDENQEKNVTEETKRLSKTIGVQVGQNIEQPIKSNKYCQSEPSKRNVRMYSKGIQVMPFSNTSMERNIDDELKNITKNKKIEFADIKDDIKISTIDYYGDSRSVDPNNEPKYEDKMVSTKSIKPDLYENDQIKEKTIKSIKCVERQDACTSPIPLPKPKKRKCIGCRQSADDTTKESSKCCGTYKESIPSTSKQIIENNERQKLYHIIVNAKENHVENELDDIARILSILQNNTCSKFNDKKELNIKNELNDELSKKISVGTIIDHDITSKQIPFSQEVGISEKAKNVKIENLEEDKKKKMCDTELTAGVAQLFARYFNQSDNLEKSDVSKVEEMMQNILNAALIIQNSTKLKKKKRKNSDLFMSYLHKINKRTAKKNYIVKTKTSDVQNNEILEQPKCEKVVPNTEDLNETLNNTLNEISQKNLNEDTNEVKMIQESQIKLIKALEQLYGKPLKQETKKEKSRSLISYDGMDILQPMSKNNIDSIIITEGTSKNKIDSQVTEKPSDLEHDDFLVDIEEKKSKLEEEFTGLLKRSESLTDIEKCQIVNEIEKVFKNSDKLNTTQIGPYTREVIILNVPSENLINENIKTANIGHKDLNTKKETENKIKNLDGMLKRFGIDNSEIDSNLGFGIDKNKHLQKEISSHSLTNDDTNKQVDTLLCYNDKEIKPIEMKTSCDTLTNKLDTLENDSLSLKDHAKFEFIKTWNAPSNNLKSSTEHDKIECEICNQYQNDIKQVLSDKQNIGHSSNFESSGGSYERVEKRSDHFIEEIKAALDEYEKQEVQLDLEDKEVNLNVQFLHKKPEISQHDFNNDDNNNIINTAITNIITPSLVKENSNLTPKSSENKNLTDSLIYVKNSEDSNTQKSVEYLISELINKKSKDNLETPENCYTAISKWQTTPSIESVLKKSSHGLKTKSSIKKKNSKTKKDKKKKEPFISIFESQSYKSDENSRKARIFSNVQKFDSNIPSCSYNTQPRAEGDCQTYTTLPCFTIDSETKTLPKGTIDAYLKSLHELSNTLDNQLTLMKYALDEENLKLISKYHTQSQNIYSKERSRQLYMHLDTRVQYSKYDSKSQSSKFKVSRNTMMYVQNELSELKSQIEQNPYANLRNEIASNKSLTRVEHKKIIQSIDFELNKIKSIEKQIDELVKDLKESIESDSSFNQEFAKFEDEKSDISLRKRLEKIGEVLQTELTNIQAVLTEKEDNTKKSMGDLKKSKQSMGDLKKRKQSMGDLKKSKTNYLKKSKDHERSKHKSQNGENKTEKKESIIEKLKKKFKEKPTKGVAKNKYLHKR